VHYVCGQLNRPRKSATLRGSAIPPPREHEHGEQLPDTATGVSGSGLAFLGRRHQIASEVLGMSKTEDADPLLTASDAARILGLSRDMVRVLARSGRLPSTRTANGYHLFRRADVESLARARATLRERHGRQAMSTKARER
jgi:excisionase family DNA binding protein